MAGATIWFRTRGGPTHGWGNIFRLAAFADLCRRRGHEDCSFFVEGPPEVHTWLEERGFAVVALPEGISVGEEARILSEHGRADLVVMEMLEVTWSRQAMLRERADRLVVFDDLCDHVYCADVVVCGQALPSTANQVLSASHTRFLTGLQYFPCRPEFDPWLARPREHRPRLRSVLVTLGGGRYDVGYLKCALALRELGDDVRATFVLGYADHGSVAHRIRDLLPGADVRGGVRDMPRLLWSCDLAIVSAGYSKIEAALTATPAVMMSVQWHQIPLGAEFEKRTGMRDLGYMSYVHPHEIESALEALRPREAREAAARRARAALDGHGLRRVAEALFGPTGA